MKDAADNRLGAYLRARRDLVTPDRAGITAGPNRRVPGLRREEVAMLAGISADYYLRLERGQDTHPSDQVLTALAGVLQLDDVERAYVHELASPAPTARRRRRPETVPARLNQLLAVVGVPAFIEGRAFDVLATNDLAVALSPRLRPGQNRMRSFFLDPEEREFHHDWESAAAQFVAMFRQSVQHHSQDPRVVELVGELSLASAHFRKLWARHDVRLLQGGTVMVHHPSAGDLQLYRDKLDLDGLTLVLYYADQGSESDQRLSMLSSLTLASPSADGNLTAEHL